MTDRLKKIMEMREKRQDIPTDSNIIIDWMDDKVYRLNMVKDIYAGSPEALDMGHYDESLGEYTDMVRTCCWMTNALEEVFIYRGLTKLAEAAGLEIKTRPHAGGNVQHYFTYKGIKFFELTEPDEVLR